MPQVTLDLPERLVERLARLVDEQQKSMEQVAIEQIECALTPVEECLAERYERFIFVSADDDLLIAAQAEGLIAENPSRYL